MDSIHKDVQHTYDNYNVSVVAFFVGCNLLLLRIIILSLVDAPNIDRRPRVTCSPPLQRYH